MALPQAIATSTPTPTPGPTSYPITETGTVYKIDTYGDKLVDIYPGTPVTHGINCFASNAPTFSKGQQVVCTGIYHRGATGNQWIAASSLTLSSGSTPTPAPIVAKHVMTYDYLGYPKGTTNISWSQAAPFLTWASTGWAASAAIHAVGIKTTVYENPNRVLNDGGWPLYSAPEAAFAHDCSGNRVTDVFGGYVTQYVMDPTNSTLLSSFLSLVVSPDLARGTFDSIYLDNMGPLSEYGPGSFKPSLPCGYSDAAWVAGQTALAAGLPLPTFFNGLGGLNPYGGYGLSLSLGLFSSSNTMGGMWEHCYTTNNQTLPKAFGARWLATENTALTVGAQGRTFICMPSDNYAAPGSARAIDERTYSYASFLLTYNPNTSMLWDFYPASASGLKVNPESQLVALDPVVPTPSDISGLLLPAGVYGREYNSCYLAGAYVGPCAAVVNSDYYHAHAWPYTKYLHTMVLTGSGVLDGGSIATNGPPPPASVPALGSAIAFP